MNQSYRTRIANALALLALMQLQAFMQVGCIPDDTSRPLGAVRVLFDPSIYMQTGRFETADRWLVDIEAAAFAAELYVPCNYLNEGTTQWVFSGRASAEFLFRGIEAGPCGRFGGRIGADFFQVEQTELARPRAGAANAAAVSALAGSGRHALLVGSASKNGQTYRFRLVIDPLVTPCVTREREALEIEAGARIERRVRVSPERLFALEDTSNTRFDAFAYADEVGNANGEVEEAELGRILLDCDYLKFRNCLAPSRGSYETHLEDPAYNTPNLLRYLRRQLNFVIRFDGSPDCSGTGQIAPNPVQP